MGIQSPKNLITMETLSQRKRNPTVMGMGTVAQSLRRKSPTDMAMGMEILNQRKRNPMDTGTAMAMAMRKKMIMATVTLTRMAMRRNEPSQNSKLREYCRFSDSECKYKSM